MSSADARGVVDDRGLQTAYRVTDEQVERLWELGWASVPGLLDQDVLEGIRSRLAEGEVRDSVSGPYKNKIAFVSREGLCWKDAFLREVATSRRVASAVVRFMKQPAALLAQDISFNKESGGGQSYWHQDYSYFPCDRKGGLTVWIALVDLSEDMGPIHYMERSHLEGPLGFIRPPADLRDTYPQLWNLTVGAGKAMAAGDAVVHWDLTVHGSEPNTAEGNREAWALRYMRTDTIYNGISHPHYDQFALTAGTLFADTSHFPLIGPDGLMEE